jgi:hypothetical protein
MQKTLPFLKKVGHRQLDPCFSPWERQLPQPGDYTNYGLMSVTAIFSPTTACGDVSSSAFAALDNISFTKTVNYENPIPRPISTRTAKCDLGRNAYSDYGRVVHRAAPQPREAYWES